MGNDSMNAATSEWKRSCLSHWLQGMSTGSHYGHLPTMMNYTVSLCLILPRHSNQEEWPFSPAAHKIWAYTDCLSLNSRPVAQFRKGSRSSISCLLVPNGSESRQHFLSILPSLYTESSPSASGTTPAQWLLPRELKLGGPSSDHPGQLSWPCQTMAFSRHRLQELVQRYLPPLHS